ncbi:hypothetical protein ABK040_002384 [Willaertia magna]
MTELLTPKFKRKEHGIGLRSICNVIGSFYNGEPVIEIEASRIYCFPSTIKLLVKTKAIESNEVIQLREIRVPYFRTTFHLFNLPVRIDYNTKESLDYLFIEIINNDKVILNNYEIPLQNILQNNDNWVSLKVNTFKEQMELCLRPYNFGQYSTKKVVPIQLKVIPVQVIQNEIQTKASNIFIEETTSNTIKTEKNYKKENSTNNKTTDLRTLRESKVLSYGNNNFSNVRVRHDIKTQDKSVSTIGDKKTEKVNRKKSTPIETLKELKECKILDYGNRINFLNEMKYISRDITTPNERNNLHIQPSNTIVIESEEKNVLTPFEDVHQNNEIIEDTHPKIVTIEDLGKSYLFQIIEPKSICKRLYINKYYIPNYTLFIIKNLLRNSISLNRKSFKLDENLDSSELMLSNYISRYKNNDNNLINNSTTVNNLLGSESNSIDIRDIMKKLEEMLSVNNYDSFFSKLVNLNEIISTLISEKFNINNDSYNYENCEHYFSTLEDLTKEEMGKRNYIKYNLPLSSSLDLRINSLDNSVEQCDNNNSHNHYTNSKDIQAYLSYEMLDKDCEAKIKQYEILKKDCIEHEEYLKAKRYNDYILSLKDINVYLLNLERSKREAAEQEDFIKADALKKKIIIIKKKIVDLLRVDLEVEDNVFIIQAMNKGSKERKDFSYLISSTILIQSLAVSKKQYIKFKTELYLINRIKSRIQSILLNRRIKDHFNSIYIIQALIRSKIQKMKVGNALFVLEFIKARLRIRKAILSVEIMTATIRGKFIRKNIRGIATISTVFHGLLTKRCCFEMEKVRLVNLQARVNSYLAVNTFNKQIQKVIQLQAKIRYGFCRNYVAQQYHTISNIRAMVEGKICRKNHQSQLQYLQIISSFFLGSLKRHKIQNYVRNIIIIQNVITGCTTRSKKNNEIKCVENMERISRGFLDRICVCKAMRRVKILQSLCRSYLINKHISNEKNNVISLQSCIRRYSLFNYLLKLKRNAIFIQNKIKRNQVEQEILMNVMSIQSFMRRITVKYVMKYQILSIQSLEAFLCGTNTRFNLCKIKQSIEIVQARILALIAVKRTHNNICNLTKVQAILNGIMMGKKKQTDLKCIISLQTVIKGCHQREYFKYYLSLVTSVQSLIRRNLVYKETTLTKKSLISIQCFTRSFRVKNSFILELNEKKKCASTIQCLFYGHVLRNSFCCQKENILLMQTLKRSYFKRLSIEQTKRDVILVQSLIRRFIQEQFYSMGRSVAFLIQRSAVSMRICTKTALLSITKTMPTIVSKILRVEFRKEIFDISVFQALCKRYLAFKDFRVFLQEKGRFTNQLLTFQSKIRSLQLQCHKSRKEGVSNVINLLKICKNHRTKFCVERYRVILIQSALKGLLERKKKPRLLKSYLFRSISKYDEVLICIFRYLFPSNKVDFIENNLVNDWNRVTHVNKRFRYILRERMPQSFYSNFLFSVVSFVKKYPIENINKGTNIDEISKTVVNQITLSAAKNIIMFFTEFTLSIVNENNVKCIHLDGCLFNAPLQLTNRFIPITHETNAIYYFSKLFKNIEYLKFTFGLGVISNLSKLDDIKFIKDWKKLKAITIIFDIKYNACYHSSGILGFTQRMMDHIRYTKTLETIQLYGTLLSTEKALPLIHIIDSIACSTNIKFTVFGNAKKHFIEELINNDEGIVSQNLKELSIKDKFTDINIGDSIYKTPSFYNTYKVDFTSLRSLKIEGVDFYKDSLTIKGTFPFLQQLEIISINKNSIIDINELNAPKLKSLKLINFQSIIYLNPFDSLEIVTLHCHSLTDLDFWITDNLRECYLELPNVEYNISHTNIEYLHLGYKVEYVNVDIPTLKSLSITLIDSFKKVSVIAPKLENSSINMYEFLHDVCKISTIIKSERYLWQTPKITKMFLGEKSSIYNILKNYNLNIVDPCFFTNITEVTSYLFPHQFVETVISKCINLQEFIMTGQILFARKKVIVSCKNKLLFKKTLILNCQCQQIIDYLNRIDIVNDVPNNFDFEFIKLELFGKKINTKPHFFSNLKELYLFNTEFTLNLNQIPKLEILNIKHLERKGHNKIELIQKHYNIKRIMIFGVDTLYLQLFLETPRLEVLLVEDISQFLQLDIKEKSCDQLKRMLVTTLDENKGTVDIISKTMKMFKTEK